MKRRILLAAVLVAISLTACSTSNDNKISEESVSAEGSTVDEIAATEESSEADTPEEQNASEDEGSEAELREIYLASVKKLYDEGIDLFGNEIESFNQKDEYNHFAIYDVDGDGTDELILSWGDSFVAGMWGGVYQYDFETESYHDEGLVEPEITFYDNGVAYEPWRHNQGPGEMWPYDAYLYNKDKDEYEHVLSADSWNKDYREEGFPDSVDTDGVGVVYFTDKDAEYVDYDNPISQTDYNSIEDEYFEGANEIAVTYYELSDKGIEEYMASQEGNRRSYDLLCH